MIVFVGAGWLLAALFLWLWYKTRRRLAVVENIAAGATLEASELRRLRADWQRTAEGNERLFQQTHGLLMKELRKRGDGNTPYSRR